MDRKVGEGPDLRDFLSPGKEGFWNFKCSWRASSGSWHDPLGLAVVCGVDLKGVQEYQSAETKTCTNMDCNSQRGMVIGGRWGLGAMR